MVNFILFCFASIGMTLIVVNSSLFQPFRTSLTHGVEKLHRRRQKKGTPPGFTLIEFIHGMVHCVQCCGFWSGLFCGLFLITSDSVWTFSGLLAPGILMNRMLMLFCCGAAGSILSMFTEFLLNWLHFSKEYYVMLVMRGNELAVQNNDPGDETETDQEKTVAGIPD